MIKLYKILLRQNKLDRLIEVILLQTFLTTLFGGLLLAVLGAVFKGSDLLFYSMGIGVLCFIVGGVFGALLMELRQRLGPNVENY